MSPDLITDAELKDCVIDDAEFELTGPTGQVATLDIDPEVTDHASTALTATGYERVRVFCGDGALGDPEGAPFDKITVTVGPWDLPPAWFDQLGDSGRLVVPLAWRGQSRSVAFTKHRGALVSADSRQCGFIPMTGMVPAGERTGQVTDQIAVYWDQDQPINPRGLRDALTTEGFTAWSGVTVAPEEPFDHIWLRLTATEPGACRLAATDDAIEIGPCQAIFPDRAPAIVDGDSLAYLSSPRPIDTDGERRYELSATGHGAAGHRLAERFRDHIRSWDHDRTAQPTITAYPAGTSNQDLPDGLIIGKHHTRLVLSV